MDERLGRIAKNENLFREVNERIEDLSETFQVSPQRGEFEFHCECGQQSCETMVWMTVREYEGVRSQRDRFLLAPGHETPEIEKTVERHERYVVVDKLPEAEPFVGADGLPRSGG